MKKQKLVVLPNSWEKTFSGQLPLMGHRNWVVIADAAYPQHSAAAIETLKVKGDPLQTIRKIVALVDSSPHLAATIYTDLELQFVAEKDAPGVTRFRRGLGEVLNGRQASALPHEEIIAKLDECARTFRVLVLKTEQTIPYTSVFLELGCGYWPSEAEQRMRAAMRKRNCQ